MSWTLADLPDQSGRVAIVTGANSGIGRWAAQGLAGAGARVVLACRTVSKGEAAATEIRAAHPEAEVEVRALDLADLDSVRAFAAAWEGPLDLLVNNAGVMALPRRTTAQGFEMQLGTNHLGHFALTGLLFPALSDGGGRVVNVSSQAHRMGRIRFADLMGEKSYQRWLAYGQSKLANLLFTHELVRRCAAREVDVLAVACHPGWASTHLQEAGAEMDGSAAKAWVMRTANRLFAQDASAGAWPTLRAATDPEAEPDAYYGPAGLGELAGAPVRVERSRASLDDEVSARLWEVSSELTGVRYLQD